MKYIILSEMTEGSLEIKVNRYIKDGWEPLGGVVFSRTNAMYSWHQAMILREDKP